ncbi:transmembrane protein 39b [Loa loa]|uniref:Transmembrane protein 39b n=1 Tax=Loa loa TaxID=7209 RepID=A0A1I7V7H4_LOALO|nr:transmembrane protein 39b [Loa loa]EJD74142.1 transmembrane protein 39b [Loa loa]
MVGRSTLRNRHHANANRSYGSVVPSTPGNIGRVDDRKKRNEICGKGSAQIHPIWPEMPQGQGELFFECTLFLYSVLALFLQYLNLYKTMWWLPKSYWHYSLKFHLINPYLLSCVGLLLGIRVTKCFWKTITELATNARQDGSKAHCLLWDIIEWAAVKTPMFTMVATSFLFSFSRVYFDFPFKSLLYFGHPVLFFLYLFHDNISYKMRCYATKLWFVLNGRSLSEISNVVYRGLVHPPALIDVDSVVHMCSTNPLQIREEVSVLMKDFGLRIKHCFFSGLTTAYLSIFVPCVFTPQRSPSGLPQQMYIDIFWVMELFCVVFLTSFSLYAAYLLPLQYCDLIHRCAAHLGKWERVSRFTTATAGSSGGSNSNIGDNSCYNNTSISGSNCSSTSSSSSSNNSNGSSSGAADGGDGNSTQTVISTAANTVYADWSEHNGLYAHGSVVRHKGQLYKAVSNVGRLGVAAEPGDSDHSRFYRIGGDPVTLITTMAIFQVILIAIQFWMLILTTDWQHIVTLVLLIFANYLLLAKTFKDRVIIGRIYKPSPEDLQLIKQMQQYG